MPDPVDLSFVLGLSPVKAIEYFEAKGYTISWDWRSVSAAKHAEAFTVAKAVKINVLNSIREALQDALDNGLTQAEFAKRITPEMMTLGWWGRQTIINPATGLAESAQLGSPWRMNTIYRTNLQTAFNTGRHNAQIENVEARPWWEYIAVNDRRTRPDHASIDGLIARYDDPIWATHSPQLGYNCRCRRRALSDTALARRPRNPTKTAKSLTTTTDKNGFSSTSYEYAPGKFSTPDSGWSNNPAALGSDHLQSVANKKADLLPTPAKRQAKADLKLPTPKQ